MADVKEKRLIDANALLAELDKFENPMPNKSGYDFLCGVATAITEIEDAPTVDAVEIPMSGIGDMSDGYHTFNELYHHRAMLFSVICHTMPERAWKSKLHHDGTMYDGMFIVGIDTPEGQATYHYDVEPYWDMFDVRELDRAPVFDGHTPDIAIRRIAMLGQGAGRRKTEGQTIREILFRGKRTYNGTWVFGYHSCPSWTVPPGEDVPHLIWGVGRWDSCRVDSNTVGQFTGLTDKNGKRIFEGDIGIYKQTDGAKRNGRAITCIGKVIYNAKTASFAVESKDETGCKYFDYFPIKDFEVIGNIHDNPGLLKEE